MKIIVIVIAVGFALSLGGCQAAISSNDLNERPLNDAPTLSPTSTRDTSSPTEIEPDAESIGEDIVGDLLPGGPPCPGYPDIIEFFEWRGDYLMVQLNESTDLFSTEDNPRSTLISEYFLIDINQAVNQPIQIEMPHTQERKFPALSPDGLTVAYLSNRSPNQTIEHIGRNLYLDQAGEIMLLTQLSSSVRYYFTPRWNAAGTELAFQQFVREDLDTIQIISLTGSLLSTMLNEQLEIGAR
jgi:hypothetical protein